MPKVQEIVAALKEQPILRAGEEFGIDQLKEIIADVFSAVDGFVKLFDGQFPNALLTFAAIAAKYQDPKEIFGAALEELKNMDEAEALALWQEAADEFDIEDDELEAKIEALLKLPVVTYAEINDVISLLASIQDVIKNENLSFFDKVKGIIELNEEIFQEGEDAIDLVVLWVNTIRDILPEKE